MSHSEDLGQQASHAASREIRRIIDRNRISLTALSAASGIPRSTLHSKLGGRSELTVAQLVRLAVALDVPAVDLLDPELSRARPADRPPARRRPRRP